MDGLGVVMDLPAGAARKYSFPVIVGIGHSEPLSTRAARMKIYAQLVRDLDSGGANYSHDLSDVDLSDPEDVKVTVADPNGEVLVHLGSSDYLERFKVYVAHIQEWRQQFQKVRSVDLRYDRQVIVNPDESNLPQRLAPAKSAKAKPRGQGEGREEAMNLQFVICNLQFARKFEATTALDEITKLPNYKLPISFGLHGQAEPQSIYRD